MNPRTLIEIMDVAERLKDTTRHCCTSGGRRESVAEHCWRTALLAWFLRDEFPEADMEKVISMVLIHDLGEAFTGDIPAFEKTDAHRQEEDRLLLNWVRTLPAPYAAEMEALYAEMEARQTLEARLYKALDGIEAVLQHNESDLSTWVPEEYEINRTYAEDKVGFSPWLTAFRQMIKEDTLKKLGEWPG